MAAAALKFKSEMQRFGVEWNYRGFPGETQVSSKLRRRLKLCSTAQRRSADAGMGGDYRASHLRFHCRISQYLWRRTNPDQSTQPLKLNLTSAVPEPHSIPGSAECLSCNQRAAQVWSRCAGYRPRENWLSAFDSTHFKRVLFVAHREEILGQALETFRKITRLPWPVYWTRKISRRGSSVCINTDS